MGAHSSTDVRRRHLPTGVVISARHVEQGWGGVLVHSLDNRKASTRLLVLEAVKNSHLGVMPFEIVLQHCHMCFVRRLKIRCVLPPSSFST